MECGVVQLLSAGIALPMLGILGAEERALVVIEPPGEARISGVLEIDDGVDVAVEHIVIEQLRSFVSEAGVLERGIRVHVRLYEAAEKAADAAPSKQ